jgi:hypothetical protein
MYNRVINYTGLCRNCRHINNFSSILRSEYEIDNLSREEFVENFDENIQPCPDCGRDGMMHFLFFRLNELIIDLRNEPQTGRIILQGQKLKSQLRSCDLGADDSNFGLYDYYNALTIFDKELAKLRAKNQDNEQGSLETLKSESDGSFTFSAKFSDEPPYIIPFGVSTYGFSYEEIKKILMDLRRDIKSQLQQSRIPY